MKPLRIIIILCLALCGKMFAQTIDMDAELSTLADKLAVQIKDQGKKKVAVVDFTDLQGGTSGELGKYVAEQLTVDLVMDRKDFSVLDRANLKKILDEHKLTATGLVDPGNAKMLGQFAGVDALILGTVVPKEQTVGLTVKIISTDTAEIVGATKGDFKLDNTVQQLIAKSASQPSENNSATEQASKPKPLATARFGNLSVDLTSLQSVNNQNILATFSFSNLSTNKTIAVAAYSDNPLVAGSLNSSLVTSDGTELFITGGDISGIRSMSANPHNLTPIEAGQSVVGSFTFRTTWGLPQYFNSVRIESEIVCNHNYHESDYASYNGRGGVLPPGCEKHNMLFNIPVVKK